METIDVDAKQHLRLRRFFMSVATYMGCALLSQAFAWTGYLPAWLPTMWVLGVVIANSVFFAIFRLGWNLRLRDPSMTEAQLVVSMFAVMVLIFHTDAARGAFLMLFPVPLLFGVLRLRLPQLARVGTVGVLGYAGTIALLAHYQPHRVQINLELLNLLALACVMGFVCLLGSYISKVRSELSQSIVTIRELAQHDSLTGLFNRRHLMQKLDNELARCDRNMGRGVALCMIDIDHFKRINDTFGHPVGDEVLTTIGQCLAASIRSVDYLARYGGEEFIVLLESDSNDLASAICERIRAEITQLKVPALEHMPLSVSIGLACFKKGDRPSALIERADKALYQAKATGRNRVCLA